MDIHNINSIQPFQIADSVKFRTYIRNEEQIQLPIEDLKMWRGIDPNEIGISTDFTNKNLQPIDIDLIDTENIELPLSGIEGIPPFQMSFKKAVQIYISIMNRNIKVEKGDKNKFYFLSCPGMGDILRFSISNIDTKKPELISDPPRYNGPIQSAFKDSKKQWSGAILQMLYEENHIRGYGNNGGSWWFKM